MCHTAASDIQEHTWPRWGERERVRESEREVEKQGERVRRVRQKLRVEKDV